MADTRKTLKIGVTGNNEAVAKFLHTVRDKSNATDYSHVVGVDFINYNIREDVKLCMIHISSQYIQLSQAQVKTCDKIIYFEDNVFTKDRIPGNDKKIHEYDKEKGAIEFLEDMVNKIYPVIQQATTTSKTEETVAPTKQQENVQTKQEEKVVPVKETTVAPKKSEGSIFGGVSKFFNSIRPPSQPNRNQPTVTKPFSIND